MFYDVVGNNGVAFVKSSIIKSVHGFSTRIGGISGCEHTKGLNLAFNRGDDDETVLENFRFFCESVGVDEKSVISLPQIHSDIVLEADISYVGEGYFKEPHMSADGYVTHTKGVTLGVKTADCVPIILEGRDDKGNVLAVSALHAGWRGTVKGIAKNGVQALINMGCHSENIYAAIGPAISSCCFEVGEDFIREVEKSLGKSYVNEFVFQKAEKNYADIKGMNKKILLDCGILEKNIDISIECTFCKKEKYYSHRRMSGIRGSMLSIVSLGNKHAK